MMNGRKTKQKKPPFIRPFKVLVLLTDSWVRAMVSRPLSPDPTLDVDRGLAFCLFVCEATSHLHPLISLFLVSSALRAGRSVSPSGNCYFTNTLYIMLKYFIPIKRQYLSYFLFLQLCIYLGFEIYFLQMCEETKSS